MSVSMRVKKVRGLICAAGRVKFCERVFEDLDVRKATAGEREVRGSWVRYVLTERNGKPNMIGVMGRDKWAERKISSG